MMLQGNYRGAVFALGSALLFGASTPLSKALVGDIQPVLLAAILYLSSGVGLLLVKFCQLLLRTKGRGSVEHLGAVGWLWLAGAILSGGVIAPILLMIGLTLTPAATASLLLNLEGVLTALLAWLIFREHSHSDKRLALGMVSIVAGTAVLSWQGEPTLTTVLGPILVVGACFAWAFDNNFTRKVAFYDPVNVAMLKGLCAGSFNLCLALSIGAPLASAEAIGAASLSASSITVSATSCSCWRCVTWALPEQLPTTRLRPSLERSSQSWYWAKL